MFQLAAEMLAPVLADLLGVAPDGVALGETGGPRLGQYAAMRRDLEDRGRSPSASATVHRAEFRRPSAAASTRLHSSTSSGSGVFGCSCRGGSTSVATLRPPGLAACGRIRAGYALAAAKAVNISPDNGVSSSQVTAIGRSPWCP